MLQVAIAIYFAFEFHKRARISGRRPLIWAFAGALAFFLLSTVAANAITLAGVLIGIRGDAALILIVIGTFAGLAVGHVATRRVQEHYLGSKQVASL